MKNRFFKIGSALLAIAAIAFMVACSGKSGNKYTISGTLPPDFDDEWIYLCAVDDIEPVIIDSARIENGKFKFNGVAADTITMAILTRSSKLDLMELAVDWNFVIEPGDIVVDTNSFYANGTPTNDGLKDWFTQLMTVNSDEGVADFIVKHWSEHSSDFVGAYTLAMVSSFLDFSIVDSLARQIPDELMQQYAMFRSFNEQLETIRKMQPGCKFTDFEIIDLEGKKVKLSDYVGKGDYVLVDFWASWCVPCLKAIPELQSAVTKHKNLKVIGIAIRDKVDDTREAMKQLDIKWPVFSDTTAESAVTYGVGAIPAMILFAPDGTIVAREFKPSQLDEFMK